MTAPVPGNHETYTLYAEGYYDYFGKDANGPGGFYSFDLGFWHLVALNSQICKGSTWSLDLGQQTPITKNEVIGEGCGPGTPMYEWAKRDLALHPAECTIAFFHHPLHGAEPWPAGVFLYQLQPLWQLLDDNGVDVVLNGHEHSYQRYAPQDAYGRPDPNGIVQFTVGTGASTYGSLPEGELAANMVAGQDASFGALRMTLLEGGYDFAFVTAQGEAPFGDSGHGDCV
ncbi:MAG: metallophosphoesterase [Actinomycetota bacterium]